MLFQSFYETFSHLLILHLNNGKFYKGLALQNVLRMTTYPETKIWQNQQQNYPTATKISINLMKLYLAFGKAYFGKFSTESILIYLIYLIFFANIVQLQTPRVSPDSAQHLEILE